MFTRGGDRIVKELIGLKEIHEIMEKIYEEEKELSAEQRVKKIREESDKFMTERKLNLKRLKPKEVRHIAV